MRIRMLQQILSEPGRFQIGEVYEVDEGLGRGLIVSGDAEETDDELTTPAAPRDAEETPGDSEAAALESPGETATLGRPRRRGRPE